MGRPPAQQRSSQRGNHAAQQPAMPDILTLHRGSFVQWQPSPVICSAVTSDGTVAAVGREDGQIELWDTLSWQLLKAIPGSSKSTLSSIAWVEQDEGRDRRLVSCGLDGSLVEWDTLSLRPSATTDSFGGAVWAMAVQPSPADGASPHVAVACDDGVLRLFGTAEDGPGLQYRRSFGRVEGRVLSVAWHPSGQSLVSGHSDGCIRAWDATSTREIYRITAGSGSRVWAVIVLLDGTIVSGESTGHVRFWDGRLGTQLAEFKEHLADVLALAASPSGTTVFASGVDPRITVFQHSSSFSGPSAGSDSWQYMDLKRPHTHDVRTLLTVASEGEAPLLLSGGNDAQLLAHSCEAFMQHHPTRVCRVPQRPLISTASGGGGDAPVRILSVHGPNADVWRLPAAQDTSSLYDAVSSAPVHLARMSSKNGDHLLAAAISANGSTVAMSDAIQLRVAQLSADEAPSDGASGQLLVRVQRRPLPKGTPPAHRLAFAPDGRLIAATAEGRISVIDLQAQQLLCSFTELVPAPDVFAVISAASQGRSDAKSQERSSAKPEERSNQPGKKAGPKEASGPPPVPAARLQLQPRISALAVSDAAGGWLAAAGPSFIHLYSLTNLKHAFRLGLPGDVTAAMAFAPSGNILAVATASKVVHLFGTANQRQIDWMVRNSKQMQSSISKVPGPIQGLSFSPAAQAASLLISMPHVFCYVDLHEDLGSIRKRRRQSEYVQPEDAAVHDAKADNFRAAQLDNPCLLLEYTGPSTAVLLEHAWADVWPSVPAPMYRHRYGT